MHMLTRPQITAGATECSSPPRKEKGLMTHPGRLEHMRAWAKVGDRGLGQLPGG